MSLDLEYYRQAKIKRYKITSIIISIVLYIYSALVLHNMLLSFVHHYTLFYPPSLPILTAGFSKDCLAWVLNCKSSTFGSDCLEDGSSSIVRPNFSGLPSGRVTYNSTGRYHRN